MPSQSGSPPPPALNGRRPSLPPDSGQTGWGPLVLLAPHLVLGLYLAIIPDGVAFTVTQLAVVGHVLLALVALPVFLLLVWQHARRRWSVRATPPREAARRVVGQLLALTTTFAFASGLATLTSGEGMPAATWHMVLGLLPIVPLLAHLAIGKRRAASMVFASFLLALIVALTTLRVVLPPTPERAPAPAFAFEMRPTKLYDAAAWCGECHSAIHEEWRRSTHGRALVLPKVREEFVRFEKQKGKGFPDNDLVQVKTAAPDSVGLCSHCHAPVSFYGDDKTPILEAKEPVSDGVSCSFCHTLRGVREARETTGFAGMGYYLSAPEVVRRYFGQGSSNPFLRALGNLLIRWRPEVHRRDYHAPFLDTSEACRGCHGLLHPVASYGSWHESSYRDRQAPEKSVTCQDCHMVKEMTGEKVRQPGRHVPFGPVRPQRRSHYFLGGNVRALLQLTELEDLDAGDLALLGRQRSLATKGLEVSLSGVRRAGTKVHATVVVKSVRIGHLFPAMETSQRIGWVELSGRSRSGELVASTKPPHADATPNDSPLIYRTDPNEGDMPQAFRGTAGAVAPKRAPAAAPPDTTLEARREKTFEVVLELGERASEVVEVTAAVRHSFDPLPLAEARGALP